MTIRKKAIVHSIQVGGTEEATNLTNACQLMDTTHIAKLHFLIDMPDGSQRTITIRDEDNCTVAYGDFQGLPDFLEYSQILKGEGKI